MAIEHKFGFPWISSPKLGIEDLPILSYARLPGFQRHLISVAFVTADADGATKMEDVNQRFT